VAGGGGAGVVTYPPAFLTLIDMFEPYGLMADPLSSDHVLMACAATHCLYRCSLADGVMSIVCGRDDRIGTFWGPDGPDRGHAVRLDGPHGLALAPRELYRESDALVLLL
jgi:hypothetical protein